MKGKRKHIKGNERERKEHLGKMKENNGKYMNIQENDWKSKENDKRNIQRKSPETLQNMHTAD